MTWWVLLVCLAYGLAIAPSNAGALSIVLVVVLVWLAAWAIVAALNR
jgi:hypothetical protein